MGFGHRERLVDEHGQVLEHLVAIKRTGGPDRLGGLEIESAQEHAQPAEQDPLGLAQQLMRPIH